MKSIVTKSLTSLAFLLLAAACSSNNETPVNTPTGTSTTGSPTGAPTIPGTPSPATDTPGVTRDDCPAAPTNVKLVQIAPVWNGLINLEATVAKGVPDNLELQVFNPSLARWTQSYGPLAQKVDGTYVVSTNPLPYDTSNKPLKLRVRSRLQGCTPSPWVETEPFTLSNPLVGTTWRAVVQPGELNGNIFVNAGGMSTGRGPYSLSESVNHVLAFAADGNLTEVIGFGVTSQNPGDLYNGCKIQMTFSAKWELTIENSRMILRVSARKPRATNPTEGSVCNAPTPNEWLISLPTSNVQLPAFSQQYLQLNYERLQSTPPGKATWQGQFGNAFQQALNFASDNVEPTTATINGSFFSNSGNLTYDRD
jgi:hypothetical protein